MAILEDHLGQYTGTGRWRDSLGESHSYEVTLRLEDREGALGVSFTHSFPEEPDQADIHFDATLAQVAPALLSFDLGGLPCRAYAEEDVLSYQIPLPDNLVEATFFFTPDGCTVAGSSEKNAAGNRIMWREKLTRDKIGA